MVPYGLLLRVMKLNPYPPIARVWKKWPRKGLSLVVLMVLIALFIGLAVVKQRSTGDTPTAVVQNRVTTEPLITLADNATVEVSGTIEVTDSAPLIARTGGRVTKIHRVLGQVVPAGGLVAAIDGGVVGNPNQAQVLGISTSLGIFNDIQAAALQSADNAIDLAGLNLNAAQSTTGLNNDDALLARQLRDNTVLTKDFALSDARDGGTDTLIRTTDLAQQAAQLAQDQASLSRDLTAVAGSLSAKQADINLDSAVTARERLVADLASQRATLLTQLNVAKAQHTLQQVTAPLPGEVVSLTVRVGDFVTPGQIVGEVRGLAGLQVRVNVSEAVHQQLSLGQLVSINDGRKSFDGEIVGLAARVNSRTGFSQVDIALPNISDAILSGQSVTVTLPVTPREAGPLIVPLDVVTVRQSGSVIFTVQDDVVIEHPVTIVAFEGDYVGIEVDVPLMAAVVTTGNRTLQDGDHVLVEK